MTEEELKSLLERYANEQCTADEKRLVEAWLNHLEGQSDWSWRDEQHLQLMKARIAQRIEEQKVPVKKIKRIKRYYQLLAIAASFLLIGSGIVLWKHYEEKPLVADHVIALPDQIGGAQLRMSNGTVINLTDLKEGSFNQQGVATIKKEKGNSLVYAVQDQTKEIPLADQWNTLRIPAGTTYQLTLPDGSKVWLNACSELTFPTVFGKESRNVRLKGEAYFEVASQARQPFVVEANGSTVSVLGTAFNISAYSDEPQVLTTLTGGSVAVSLGEHRLVLTPGEQAKADISNRQLGKARVDPEVFLAWKGDYFVFDDLDIQSIMHQVSRWYNTEVVFQGLIPTKKFGGTFSRTKPIEELLSYLEKLGNMHFKLENDSYFKKERRIVVMP
ncbi:DUF4974 domain-containing protein [Olivibacter ginsenosidimutans]|uniref:DUF4974 domain-containing protein n=1 Tax=Olivibacter ginsenosidimutans TaxID=1176537 RepID=A0ABP9CFL9_9SPHI